MDRLKFLFILISLNSILYSEVVVSTTQVMELPLVCSIDKRYLLPPGDQGEQGSCYAWAVAYQLSYMYKRRGEDVELSPALLYNLNNKGSYKTGMGDLEGYITLRNFGVCSIEDMPYYPKAEDEEVFKKYGTYPYLIWPSTDVFLKAMHYRISSLEYVIYSTMTFEDGRRKQPLSELDIKKLKETIYKLGHPIIISLPVWKELYKMDTTNYQWSTMDVKGSTEGWHSFLLVDLFKRII